MKRFRGTDVGLGVLAIAVNIALVVALVVWVGGRNDEPSPPPTSAATPTATASSASPSGSPTPSAAGAAAVLGRETPTTIAVLGDQTSDGTDEWVSIFAELLGRDREVTLHELDPQDPTIYANERVYGSSGPEVTIYNGSRAEAGADYAAKRLTFLSPTKPDLVVLNYGRNDSSESVAARLAATTMAVRKAWKGAVIVATLQPPTVDDGSKEVRDEVAAWAKQSGVQTLDVAKAFIDTGEPNNYVSSRDRSVMTANGDRLWGRTAYRMLVGSAPPEPEREPAPTASATSSETTEPATQSTTNVPRQTSRPQAPTRPRNTTTVEPTPEESPTFTRRPTGSTTPTTSPSPTTVEPVPLTPPALGDITLAP
ncbi:SGNH/GDSL hydrolase family protein [Knoellia sp. S7-12]|uniref:SGNH/GDSL hydrolase family protein n=1 Tax=Knoellia sp. S7-12 TaxID=3126698 RepID=UPI00336775DA